MNTQQRQAMPLPVVGEAILKHWVARFVSAEQIGDLIEEFQDRACEDSNLAKTWFNRQCFLAAINATGKAAASETFLKAMVLGCCIGLFSMLALFVAWLSNMDDVAPVLWEMILEGKVHQLLVHPDALNLMWQSAPALFDIHMFINVPSIAYASVAISGLVLLDKRRHMSAHMAALWGSILVFLPYIFSLFYIGTHDLSPRETGPIIAFAVLPAVYLLPCIAWFVVKRCGNKP